MPKEVKTLILKHLSAACFIGLLMTQTGCARLGLPMLFEGRGGAITANKNQQERTNQELLLNIVRSRYQDPVEFSPKETNRWSLFDREDRVTTKEVAALNQGYLEPIEIDTLVRLLESEWEFSLVGNLLIDSIGGFENDPAATSYPEFLQFIDFLETIQNRGDLTFIQLPESWQIGENKKSPVVMKLSFLDQEEATEFNRVTQTDGHLLADDDGSIVQLLLFVLPQEEFSFRARGAELAFVELRLRSLASQFNHFAQAIDPPRRHVKSGILELTASDQEEQDGQALKIASHWHRLKNPYASVRYRGYWFQILDADIRTKRSFALLKLLHQARYADQ